MFFDIIKYSSIVIVSIIKLSQKILILKRLKFFTRYFFFFKSRELEKKTVKLLKNFENSNL